MRRELLPAPPGSDDFSDPRKVAHAASFLQQSAEITVVPTSGFTVDAWVNLETTEHENGAVVGKGEPWNEQFVIDHLNERWRGFIRMPDNLIAGIDYPLQTGVWTHLALTWDGSTVTFYVNGQAVGSAQATSINSSTTYLGIGGRSEGGDNLNVEFPGLIDEVEYFNRALTAEEISNIAGAGTSGKCKSPSSLTCDAVIRGQEASCSVVGVVDSVIEWKFEGLLPWTQDSTTVVDSTNQMSSWTGLAVLSGKVSATVKTNDSLDTFSDDFTVADRSWSWGQSDWTFGAHAEPPSNCTFDPFEFPPDSVRLGKNVPASSGCGASGPRRIDPTVHSDSGLDAGYEEAEVAAGPNAGLWYVTGADYGMNRISLLNPYLEPDGPTRELSHSDDRKACRQPLGLKGQDPVVVNWYDYNDLCRSNPPTDMLDGILSHEGFGTGNIDANANGHEARARWSARKSGNDPTETVEAVVADSQIGLEDVLRQLLINIDAGISQDAADHQYVNNNWCGKQWVYDIPDSVYKEEQILQANGLCI